MTGHAPPRPRSRHRDGPRSQLPVCLRLEKDKCRLEHLCHHPAHGLPLVGVGAQETLAHPRLS